MTALLSEVQGFTLNRNHRHLGYGSEGGGEEGRLEASDHRGCTLNSMASTAFFMEASGAEDRINLGSQMVLHEL